MIERNTPGATFTGSIDKMGLRTSPQGDIVLEDCRVPASARIGDEGAGVAMFGASMEWERLLLYCATLGRMDHTLARCVKYAKERKAFGQAIGKFQDIAHRLIDMKAELEASRLLLYRAAWLKARSAPAALDISLAKLFASESRVRSCLHAIQVHGGYGYMTEFEIERELRNAMSGTIASGTSEVQRMIIAKHMGL